MQLTYTKNTPNKVTGIAPIEIFSGTVSDGQALKNAHVWGCPAYVLEPKLTSAGGKIPKWNPRSRRGQYVGVSPVHAETVGVVKNLTSGYLSPQYHLVFDDWFETVYSSLTEQPEEWEDMCQFNSFQTEFDGEPPPLGSDWEDKDSQSGSQAVPQGRPLYHQSIHRPDSGGVPSRATDPHSNPLPPDPALPVSPVDLQNWTRVAPSSAPNPVPIDVESPASPPPPAPNPAPTPSNGHVRRNPSRAAKTQGRGLLDPDPKKKSYSSRPSSLIGFVCAYLFAMSPVSAHMLQSQVQGYNPMSGTQEFLHPRIMQSPFALKASARRDPDLPTLRESISGPHAEQFWNAMDKEIASLESMNTWTVVE